MSPLVPAIIWYVLGVTGCALLWFERTHWKWASKKYEFLCPSPKVIVFSFFASFLGLIILITGLVIVATSDDIGAESWWNRPICKRNAVD